MRKSLFQRLEPWNDLNVCDLYAGVGTLGLEALSRGAAHVTFVEHDREVRKVLEANLAMLESPHAIVVAEDVSNYLARTVESFDIVLADPPYGATTWDELWNRALPVIRAGGELVMELAANAPLPEGLDVRRYGRTMVARKRRSA